MSVTIKDIAKKLNISTSTVSKGLNGATDISYRLTQLILDTAIEMGYKSKKMQKQINKKLCIIISNMEYKSKNDLWYDIILGFKRNAIRENCTVCIITATPELQKKQPYDNYMISNGFIGGFIIGFSLSDVWMDQFNKTTIPTVILDNYIKKNFNVSYIGTDNFEAFDMSIDLLVSKGHSKIGLFIGPLDSMISSEKFEAYLKSMKKHKLKINYDIINFNHYTNDSTKHYIQKIIKNEATAILCVNNIIASNIIEICNNMKISVPDDISIIGFDELGTSKITSPKITTIMQNRIEIGKCAYITLEGLTRNICISKIMLRPLLIQRDSISFKKE